MEISDLRYFLAVAREENITQAAENLYISQPGLTKVIQRLENEFGKTLFLREKRKVILTDDGVLLRKRAQEIIDLVDKTQNELSSDDINISGNILIGCGESDSMRLVAKAIKRTQDKYPNIQFQITSGNADNTIEKLDKGLLDFGILIGSVNVEKYNYIKLPANDIAGILLRKDSPLAENEYITIKDLKDSPLILPSQSAMNRSIESIFENNNTNLKIVARYNLIYNAGILVDEGVGYALVLDKLVNTTNLSHLKFIPLKPKTESKLVLIWKKYQIFSEASKIFLDNLNDIISEYNEQI